MQSWEAFPTQAAQEVWHSAGKGKKQDDRQVNYFQLILVVNCPKVWLDCFLPSEGISVRGFSV